MAAMTAILNDLRKKSTCRPLRMYQALSPPTTKTDISMQASHMCETPQGMSGLNMAASLSVITKRPSMKTPPVGVCIQELATMIQKADSEEPRATMHVEKK